MKMEISDLENIMNVEITNVFEEEGGAYGFVLSDGTYLKAVILSISTVSTTLESLNKKKTVTETELESLNDKITVLSGISTVEESNDTP